MDGDTAGTVDPAVEKLFDQIVNIQRGEGLPAREAIAKLRELIAATGGDAALVDRAEELFRRRVKRAIELRSPGGVHDLAYERYVDELRGLQWYTGPRESDPLWSAVSRRLRARGLDDEAMHVIDEASTKVVAHLSDPTVRRLKKKGLVVGFVQSGKTANYTATIAKAADAGYRLFIVLAGVHNGLRAQTQARLDADLVGQERARWHVLTTTEADFGSVLRGDSVLSGDKKVLCVVKKNARRLGRLAAWLKAVPEDIRVACPAVLIDDEADQATPNSKAAQDEMSRINELIRQVFGLLPSGSYVGYTATPFANVFMDPRPKDELYPADFIIDLPKPAGYLGAEDLFGRTALDDGDEPVDGIDAVRHVPEAEAELLRSPLGPPVDAPIPRGLETAISWFLLATAARRVRGHRDHSSMLVHSSPRVVNHLALKSLVQRIIRELRSRESADLAGELRDLWRQETERVPPSSFGAPDVRVDDVVREAGKVIEEVEVLVDNGQSEDRLDYSDPRPRTVIAVGGNTLSRGLTLEGLVVSYFVRKASTYDALLQMGRWFGFRPGYADLARIWTTPELGRRFRFLAGIEAEIRAEMERLEGGGTPRDFALRIRAHPDMAITSRSKMALAREVEVSFSGRRFQTFVFRNDADWLRHNLRVGRELIQRLTAAGIEPAATRGASWLFRKVPLEIIEWFLGEYWVHPKHRSLERKVTLGYLKKRSDELAQRWQVAVVGGRSRARESIDLGLPHPVPLINRAKLRDGDTENLDIKTLMSARDRLIDVDPEDLREWALPDNPSEKDLRKARRKLAGGTGLLLLYPVDRNSQPQRVAGDGVSRSREPLNAEDHVLGMGIVFPERSTGDGGFDEDEGVFIGLPDELLRGAEEPVDDAVDAEEFVVQTVDREGDAVYDA